MRPAGSPVRLIRRRIPGWNQFGRSEPGGSRRLTFKASGHVLINKATMRRGAAAVSGLIGPRATDTAGISAEFSSELKEERGVASGRERELERVRFCGGDSELHDDAGDQRCDEGQ